MMGRKGMGGRVIGIPLRVDRYRGGGLYIAYTYAKAPECALYRALHYYTQLLKLSRINDWLCFFCMVDLMPFYHTSRKTNQNFCPAI